MRAMRRMKRSQSGFTLIELLIVVAILGILAAVIIPNVGRFIGEGEGEARKAEYHDISTSITALMVENNLLSFPFPVGSVSGGTCSGASKDMGLYPDITADYIAKAKLLPGTWAPGDKLGYVLFKHDMVGDSAATTTVNYVNFPNASYWYTVESDGTVHQCDGANGAELNP